MSGPGAGELVSRLQTLHDEAREHATRLEAELESIRLARADADADDEHDPEGPTMSQQWSHTDALLQGARNELAQTERALLRVADGSYGRCARCGGPIAPARLEARPFAEHCIDCASALEQGR